MSPAFYGIGMELYRCILKKKYAEDKMSQQSQQINGKKQSFKESNSFSKRSHDAANIRQKYPNRIPIICEKGKSQKSSIPEIDKSKFLVPRELTVGQFLYIIRSRLKLEPNLALFLFVGNNVLPSTCTELGELDNEYRDEDGFLYTSYTGESAFGFLN